MPQRHFGAGKISTLCALCVNIMSFTKPEVHSALQRQQTETEPRPR